MNVHTRIQAIRVQPRRGFTLVELVVVLAIIGLLASVAFSAYTNVINDARISEAVTTMTDIKAKQMSYQSAYQVFRNCTLNPSAITSPNAPGTWDDTDTCWRELRVDINNSTEWQYRTVSSCANTTDTACAEAGDGVTTELGTDTNRMWFYVEGRSDLDGDGSTTTQVFIDSQNSPTLYRNRGR